MRKSHIAIAAAAAALLGLGVLLRPASPRPAVRPSHRTSAARPIPMRTTEAVPYQAPEPLTAPPKAADPARQAKALYDSTLLDLIRTAKVAARQRDPITRDAMLDGLRKHKARACELVQREQSRSSDPDDVTALQSLLEDLQ